MAQGLGLAGGYGAGAAADELQEVLKQRYLEGLQRTAQRERDRAYEQGLQQEAERRREWQVAQDRAMASDKSLADARAAQAARDRAAAEKDANRQTGLQRVIDDPNTPPALRNLLTLNSLGVANVGIHDTETPEAHAAHVRAENQTKSDEAFGEWKRRTDYTESVRDQRPLRPRNARLAPGQDDPGLPHGTQRYLVEIARKHPGDYQHAVAELSTYLQDPQTQRQHPGLSATRAMTALRQSYSGAGRPSDETDALVDAVLSGAGGGAPSNTPPSVNTMRPANVQGGDAQLRERARAAIRERLGRDPSDEEVSKVLANPKNRQLLSGGQ
jgi:hypothetical protein